MAQLIVFFLFCACADVWLSNFLDFALPLLIVVKRLQIWYQKSNPKKAWEQKKIYKRSKEREPQFHFSKNLLKNKPRGK